MKAIIILSLTLLLICGSVLAADGPFDRGSAKVGGGLLFMKQGGDAYYDITQLTISPQYTKFNSSGMYYGGAFYVHHNSLYSDTYWSIGPVLGIYFNDPQYQIDVKGRAFPFMEMSASVGRQTDVSNYSIAGTIGMTVMATNSVGLDFSANLSFDTFRIGRRNTSGFTILVGVGFSSFIF